MTAPPMPAYGWVPQYRWDPHWGWQPQWVWHPQQGWVHGFIWAPLPVGWTPPWGTPEPPRARRYDKVPHQGPTPYLQLLRTRAYGWWKPLLGLLLAGAVWLLASVVLVVVAVLIAGGGSISQTLIDDIAANPFGSPAALLTLNLNLALLIPSVWVAVLVVHQERLGWVSSVVRRLRWRLLLTFGAVAAGLLAIGLLVGYLLVAPGGSGSGQSYDGRFVASMLAVVLLTTPLQAAGEEYFFRGYLSQVIAGWIPGRRVGAIVAGLASGLLFALAHGQQDLPTFLSRLAFGLTASLVVYRTGGLEASIAYHTMNNVLLFVLLLAADPSLEVEVSSGAVLLTDLAVMAGFVGFVWWWSRRRSIQRTTAPTGPVAQLGPSAPSGSVGGRRESADGVWGNWQPG